MPDISGATVFDDLPESIITGEILLRLPSKDVLRCGAVSRSWHGATTSKEFLLDHHRCQPALPLLILSGEGAIDAFNSCEGPAKRRPVLGYNTRDRGSTLHIHASCDGLLLLSRCNDGFSIVNPTTRQWLALPLLTGAYENITGIPLHAIVQGKIAGMYPDPHGSDEYRILFRTEEPMDRNNASYYILTVGSSQNQKPKCIGPSVASGIAMWGPPVLLNGCLHWVQGYYPEDGLLVFDTAKESFRWMSLPVRGQASLLQTECTLSMWSLGTRVMKVWVLQDYEREVWSLKCEIELPMVKYWSNTLLSHKGYTLIYSVGRCWHQLHYDEHGKLLEEFKWETNYYRHITKYRFKESLIRHTFFFQGEEVIM